MATHPTRTLHPAQRNTSRPQNKKNPSTNPSSGWTSSNGPNWIGFLTTTYNASTLQTYNLAYGGATVDSALVTPYAPTVLSLKDQIQKQFLPIYGSHPSSAPWTSSDSLFSFFIGINDVGNSWWLSNATTTLHDAIFTLYASLLADVYKTGARNFLLLNVPPVNLAPLTLAKNDDGYSVREEGKVIAAWNQRVKRLARAFSAEYPAAKVFVHDTWTLFSNVIANPNAWPQTSALKNVTGFCAAYAK